jgi:KDO2-lipid IV(A) lauroyltransferase
VRFLFRMFMNAVVLFGRLEALILPVSWLFAMGRWSARLIFRFVPSMREALLDNAKHLLGPESTQEQREAQAVGVLTSFSRFFVEMLTPRKTLPLNQDLYEIVDGMEHAEAARAKGPGVICVTLHMGNYELGPMLIPQLVEQPVAVVYTPDPWGVFENLRSGRRRQRRVVEIPIKGSLFTVEARRVLERGGVVLAAADEGFSHQRGKVYPFLDGHARFLDWPAHLAKSTGVCLVPCVCYRDAEGAYRFEMKPAIEPGEIDVMMSQMVGAFGEFVQRFPEQWLILHRYWLTPAEVDGD